MIERMVMLKLTDEHATDEGRAAFVAHSKEALSAVPGVQRVTIGVPADDAARASWDIALHVFFARYEDVEPYRVHPLHRRYVTEFLEPRVECRKVWNFDVG